MNKNVREVVRRQASDLEIELRTLIVELRLEAKQLDENNGYWLNSEFIAHGKAAKAREVADALDKILEVKEPEHKTKSMMICVNGKLVNKMYNNPQYTKHRNPIVLLGINLKAGKKINIVSVNRAAVEMIIIVKRHLMVKRAGCAFNECMKNAVSTFSKAIPMFNAAYRAAHPYIVEQLETAKSKEREQAIVDKLLKEAGKDINYLQPIAGTKVRYTNGRR